MFRSKLEARLLRVLGSSLTLGPQPLSAPLPLVKVGDFNGDGDPDLTVNNFGSKNISVIWGNGRLTGSVVAIPNVVPAELAVPDFNN